MRRVKKALSIPRLTLKILTGAFAILATVIVPIVAHTAALVVCWAAGYIRTGRRIFGNHFRLWIFLHGKFCLWVYPTSFKATRIFLHISLPDPWYKGQRSHKLLDLGKSEFLRVTLSRNSSASFVRFWRHLSCSAANSLSFSSISSWVAGVNSSCSEGVICRDMNFYFFLSGWYPETDGYTKSVGTEPLLVPPLEALACAHRRKTSNVQSPRKYVKSRWPTYASRHPSHRISIYISMSIYHCIYLAYDIETARFQEAKNGSASKRFCHYVCDSPYWRATVVTLPLNPLPGSASG